MTLYDELIARGLIAQVTNEDEIKNMINNGKATFYIGFDCTADSLHVGHFMALCLMKRLQMAGNKPIALIGDGTTLIGDPSGRTDMRQMLTEETIKHNAECFKRQMERFIDFSDGKALMLYNSEWLKPLNYIELLREVGACFSVNNMLRAECYKQRMEKGLSFLEFNYMIMQSYDFYYMFQHYGCNMQFGGNDQWSNMLGGTELIRRKLGKDAHAMTITLLLNSEGKKMGKTAKGAVWLDPNKTSPFEFYQYWRNVDDADVLKCIRPADSQWLARDGCLIDHCLAGNDFSVERDHATGADYDVVAGLNVSHRHEHRARVRLFPDLIHIQGHGLREISNGLLMRPLIKSVADAQQEHDGACRLEVLAQHRDRNCRCIQHRYLDLLVHQTRQSGLDIRHGARDRNQRAHRARNKQLLNAAPA
jgi:hypothetical protein